MRKRSRFFFLAVAILVLLWLGAAGLVWSRNRVPALALPAMSAMPADNVFDEYVKCVSEISAADKGPIGEYANGKDLPPATKQAVLAKNQALLARFHGLMGRPSVATSLEPGAKFTPLQDYLFLSWLVIMESEEQRKTDPAHALDTLLDGLVFGEDVLRGGAAFHQAGNKYASMPIFRTLPAVLPTLSAPLCEKGAKRLHTLIETQYPLKELLQKERLVRVNQLIHVMQPLSTRILRFQIPTDGEEWQYMMRPKTSAVSALNAYLIRWEEAAEKPVAEIEPPSSPPTELENILGQASVKASGYIKTILRYRYSEARLRMAYVAFRLEQYRKTRGQYPAILTELGSDPYFTDPFSGKPFIYKQEGSGFILYSVGQNSQDDGNAPEQQDRDLDKDSRGDIAFDPKFRRLGPAE